jgi:hypothetical protein
MYDGGDPIIYIRLAHLPIFYAYTLIQTCVTASAGEGEPNRLAVEYVDGSTTTSCTAMQAMLRATALSEHCPSFDSVWSTPTGQMAEPIFTINGSDDSVWCKEDPFGVHFATKCQQILRDSNSFKTATFSDPCGDFERNQISRITFEW